LIQPRKLRKPVMIPTELAVPRLNRGVKEMKLKDIVDRIEYGYAVLLIRPEEKEKIDWPVKFLPDDVEEGDILEFGIERDLKEKEDAEERVRG